MTFFRRKQPLAGPSTGQPTTTTASASNSPSGSDGVTDAIQDSEKTGELDDSHVPFLTLRTAVMTLLVAMGGFIFGYDTGQISGFLEMNVFLERFGQYNDQTNKYYFTNVRSGLIVGLLSIGTLLGCLLAAPLSNRFGRRTCIPFWCLVFAIGVTIQVSVASGQWVGIVMGRWVAGFGIGACSVLVPLYMSESAPKHVRGAVVCCYQLFVTIGIFTADCINYGTETRNDTGSYRIPMAIGYIWALILGIGMIFMPESPRWDIRRGNHDRGFNTMTKFYGVSRHHRVVDVEVREIDAAMQAASGDHPWYEAFTGPRMFYRVLLGIALQMFQQLTGANYFFYYGTTVFTGVGLSNSYVTAMILGGVNVGATFFGLYFVEHFGRRVCLFWGALWQFMCFVVFANVGHFMFQPAAEGSQQAKTSGTVMIVFACLFIVSFASTWGPMVWTAIGELFPYRYRAIAMALATASNWTFNFLLAFFTPFITGDIDFLYGWVFAGCNLAAAVMIYFCLIESSGRTLEEIDYMYIIHVSPMNSSKWDPNQAGENVTTDELFLDRGGRSIQKRNEADQEGISHEEGLMGGPVDTSNVTEVHHSRETPVLFSGARAQ
ncbi:MAG: hexose transporter hxt1 [Claussenomyces sp. TS43310]|nr:MAG: hexose transporter hxt1 [Claussenomyces sp. TS43310]